MTSLYTAALGRSVELRPGTSDADVWAATFNAKYHVPPEWMPEPRSVLDLGANIGLTAAHYQALWPAARVTAIEMDHENAKQACVNWGGNVFEAAVVATLRGAWDGYNPDAAAEAYALGTGHHKPAHRVTMPRACNLASRLGPVDFVKMDIEGMEWKLFDHGEAWAPLVKHLLVELHYPSLPPHSVQIRGAEMLARLGFDSEASTHPAGLFAWRA